MRQTGRHRYTERGRERIKKRRACRAESSPKLDQDGSEGSERDRERERKREERQRNDQLPTAHRHHRARAYCTRPPHCAVHLCSPRDDTRRARGKRTGLSIKLCQPLSCVRLLSLPFSPLHRPPGSPKMVRRCTAVYSSAAAVRAYSAAYEAHRRA